jgi:predicted transcriptional regulator
MRNKNLSEANYEIMKLLWEHGELSINDVHSFINEKRNEKVRRTTIQVQLKRLEKYGWVKHREENRTFYYQPLKDHKATNIQILEDIKTRMFKGSRTELVRYLFGKEKVSDSEIKELKKIIKDFEKGEK